MTPILLAGGMAFVATLLPAAAAPAQVPFVIAASEGVASDRGGSEAVGRCGEYVAIAGSADIVRVEQTAASMAQATSSGGPGYAGYEVWFSFTPDRPVSDAETADWISKEHELRLANSWYPGPAFVERYGLEAGAVIPAILDAQKSGPCTPFVVRFPTVDTTDYFESAK